MAEYSTKIMDAAAHVNRTLTEGMDRSNREDLELLEEAGLMDREICEDDSHQDSVEAGELIWYFTQAGEELIETLHQEGPKHV